MGEHASNVGAYRVEISGGFSGSAYRCESLLTGSLAEVERFIAAVTEDDQAASMMITEAVPRRHRRHP